MLAGPAPEAAVPQAIQDWEVTGLLGKVNKKTGSFGLPEFLPVVAAEAKKSGSLRAPGILYR